MRDDHYDLSFVRIIKAVGGCVVSAFGLTLSFSEGRLGWLKWESRKSKTTLQKSEEQYTQAEFHSTSSIAKVMHYIMPSFTLQVALGR